MVRMGYQGDKPSLWVLQVGHSSPGPFLVAECQFSDSAVFLFLSLGEKMVRMGYRGTSPRSGCCRWARAALFLPRGPSVPVPVSVTVPISASVPDAALLRGTLA